MDDQNELKDLKKAVIDMANRNEQRDAQMTVLLDMMQQLSMSIPVKGKEEAQDEKKPPKENSDLAALVAKVTKLEESASKSKKLGIANIDMDDLFLFPRAKLPDKFKVPDFTKFDGTGDPKAHLMGYVGTLSMWDVEKEAMAQMFHQSLSGAALQWFLCLDVSRKRTWEDIGTAFVAQYSFNTQLKMSIRELESTRMDAKESFADFVKRWRSKAAQMTERPSDEQQIRMITRLLPPTFAKHMVLSQALEGFDSFYKSGLIIEEAMRNGILDKEDYSPKPKRGNFGNNNMPFGSGGYTSASSSNPSVNAINTQSNRQQGQPRTMSQFDKPLSQVFELLQKQGKIQPLDPTPLPANLSPKHNPNAYCAYHQMSGHPTDKCYRLQHKIQDLIDSQAIPRPPLKPNTITNPIPQHNPYGAPA